MISSLDCSHFTSDVGLYDRVVIQEILKEIAQTQQVDLGAKQRFKGEHQHPTWIRIDEIPVVVINEADSLTRDAQAALRRTMEKYMANMRIILCSTRYVYLLVSETDSPVPTARANSSPPSSRDACSSAWVHQPTKRYALIEKTKISKG